MKSDNLPAAGARVLRHPIEIMKPTIIYLPLLAVALALALTTLPAKAQITNSLLVNPSFEANSGQAIPTGWTYFAPPQSVTNKDYWIVNAASANDHNAVTNAQSGTYWWKQWNELYKSTVSNVAGIYQIVGASPGSIYQANGWMTSSSGDALPSTNDYCWIQVEFLDANSNLLSLYKSDIYNINAGTTTWFPFQVTNVCDITQPVPTGDPSFNTYAITGSVNQLVAPAGAALIRYRLCDFFSASDGGSEYFDSAALEQVSGPVPPAINNLNPQNEIFVPPSSGLSFNVTSPSGFTINNSGIQLFLNGSNVSSGLVITGSASSKNVTYNGLQSNLTYNATINVTDVSNLTSSANTTFQTTWVGVPGLTYLWEAEDFDFNGGQYIDNPDLCTAPGDSDCYFGQVGEQNVDEYSTGVPPAQFYRGAADGIGTQPSGDFSRPNLSGAGRVDYCINPFNGTPSYSGAEWVNYTRDWPNSTNWIVARLSTDVGLSGSMQMSVVNPGVSTNVLGTFTINSGLGWTTFEYVYLIGTNGVNKANVVLNGKETLQVTSGGNLLPTFFMLVPAEPDLPFLSKLYPTGTHPFEPTNALSFTVTTLGATFPANGIQVVLDGINITSDLVITGSTSSNNVVYPYLGTNETHLAIITVTNSLGHGISVTNQFDTFNQNNYIVQAEDFDFNGGQYVPTADYQPDAYASYSSIPEVDFHHTINGGEPTDGSDYQYRQNGIPQESTPDYYLATFAANPFLYVDYNLYWYGGGDWANYTRDYPSGPFNIYVRTAGIGAYTMDLGQVVSGLGTSNQVVKPLGQFSSTGININTFGWVPLTDAGGVAAVTVNVPGTSTFQLLTPTGDCYPNYFMLVPASPIHLTAARVGNNINISFLAQTGSVYRVFYRTNLLTGSWTLLNSALGNGSTESVTDSPASGSLRFYKVTSP
jgi:hypothetical protein